MGIDESGKFHFDIVKNKELTFVGGVLVSKNEDNAVLKLYQDCYELLHPHPQSKAQSESKLREPKLLLGGDRFHYEKLKNTSDGKKVINKIREFLNGDKKIFKSVGVPLLWANGQDYWQTSVMAVISGLFTNHSFQSGDVVNIFIDHRDDRFWGLTPEDPMNKWFHKNEIDGPDFKEFKRNGTELFSKYHQIIKRQFQKIVKQYEENYNIKVNIDFKGNTSFYTNLADIACGWIRYNEQKEKCNRENELKFIKCPCENIVGAENPDLLVDNHPIAALGIVLRRAMVGKLNSDAQEVVSKAFKITASDKSEYSRLWDVFHNFLQYQIDNRSKNENTIAKLNNIVGEFRNEFKTNSGNIAFDKQLEYIKSFMKYYSHAGEVVTEIPIEENEFVLMLDQADGSVDEGRTVRKWDSYVSHNLRAVQFHFNSYNFTDKILEHWEKILKKQTAMLNTLNDDPMFNSEKDEHTAAIHGTLGQYCAFREEIEDARKHFEESLKYAVKESSKTQTYSYLFTLSFIEKDLEKLYKYFEEQTGIEPKNFKGTPTAAISWNLVSYAKLRALELYKNNSTELPEINGRDGEYPWPLVYKWNAVARLLKNQNDRDAEVYLSTAINNLLNNETRFTVKTLALPIMQIQALALCAEPAKAKLYALKYEMRVGELRKESQDFAQYIDEKAPLLKSINTAAINDDKSRRDELWNRAAALPFNYS